LNFFINVASVIKASASSRQTIHSKSFILFKSD